MNGPALATSFHLVSELVLAREREPVDYHRAYYAVRGAMREFGPRLENGTPPDEVALMAIAASSIILLRAVLATKTSGAPLPESVDVDPPPDPGTGPSVDGRRHN